MAINHLYLIELTCVAPEFIHVYKLSITTADPRTHYENIISEYAKKGFIVNHNIADAPALMAKCQACLQRECATSTDSKTITAVVRAVCRAHQKLTKRRPHFSKPRCARWGKRSK